MYVIASVKDVVYSLLIQVAFLYAAFTALQQRYVSQSVCGHGEEGEAAAQDGCNTGADTRNRRRIAVPALKLWIMLMTTTAVTRVGLHAVPLFDEMRILALYFILLGPPASQAEVYDKLFYPCISRVSDAFLNIQHRTKLLRIVALRVVRWHIFMSVVLLNYVCKCEALTDVETKEILSGLLFSRRALDDIAKLENEKKKTLVGGTSVEGGQETKRGGAHDQRGARTESAQEQARLFRRQVSDTAKPVQVGSSGNKGTGTFQRVHSDRSGLVAPVESTYYFPTPPTGVQTTKGPHAPESVCDPDHGDNGGTPKEKKKKFLFFRKRRNGPPPKVNICRRS
ncbi:hypothetical protein AGDE_08502 [Angomonas deanei]|uniref:TB2/DP1, HVA22 family n=1 Tax=Angomonas deanei TaxID=59799 RepID=A0A7G2CCD5_9TRYP|nr:hypothetical protein AGDE_08502 [Angomonas deanei]CAD2216607.1 hypothetical protein, conserved [Angomonas deanei]|eukprot:EPY32805.1 hypothetical protein AGDE_08502 [Angomonas deanei]